MRAFLPVTGPEDMARTAREGPLAFALFGAFAALMLLWQARAGPAAQLLAIPGAAALIWAMGRKSVISLK